MKRILLSFAGVGIVVIGSAFLSATPSQTGSESQPSSNKASLIETSIPEQTPSGTKQELTNQDSPILMTVARRVMDDSFGRTEKSENRWNSYVPSSQPKARPTLPIAANHRNIRSVSSQLLPDSETEQMIHHRAKQQAEMRRARIATRKWFGHSLARPALPQHGNVIGPVVSHWSLQMNWSRPAFFFGTRVTRPYMESMPRDRSLRYDSTQGL